MSFRAAVGAKKYFFGLAPMQKLLQCNCLVASWCILHKNEGWFDPQHTVEGSTEECSKARAARCWRADGRQKWSQTSIERDSGTLLCGKNPLKYQYTAAEGKAVKKSTDLAIKGQYRRTGVWPKGTVEIEG